MSLLSQMAMSDTLYQQQQKEREDREFELLKRKHEQAKLDQEAYLMPFETKETMAQYEDANEKRQADTEQKAMNKWVVPYEPQIGMNEDGTRQMDIRTPIAPAVAGLMAAGLGTMGNNVEDFVKPFDDQAINNSRKYNTPEEIKKKADTELAQKNSLELAAARKTALRPPRASSAKSPEAKESEAMKKQYVELVKKAYEHNQKEFHAKKGRTPEGDEITALSKKAVAAAKAQMDVMYPQPAAQPPSPAAKPAAKPVTPQGDPGSQDPFEMHERFKNEAVAPPAAVPETKTVSLEEKQAGGPVSVPPAPGTTLNFDQNPEIQSLAAEKAKTEAALAQSQSSGGLDSYVATRILQDKLRKITARLDAMQKEATMSTILGNQNPGSAPWLK